MWMRGLEGFLAMHLEHVIAEVLGAFDRVVSMRGVFVRDPIHAAEDEQMNDEEVGEKDEPRRSAREYEAGKVERELVVQFQVRVAFLLLTVGEFRERVEFLLVVVRVFA